MPTRNVNAMLGKRIRELRVRRKMSQEQLAEAAGLHRNMVGLLERGRRSPSLATMCRIADALGVHPKQLLTKF